eukprot:354903-Chlamydomonas_euryale.AAC.12
MEEDGWICMCVCVCVCGVCVRIACHSSSAIRRCHEEGSGVGTTFRYFLKLPGHTKLIPWPGIREAAAERALDRQAWRNAMNNVAPLEFNKPQQAGRMTWSCTRRGGSVHS